MNRIIGGLLLLLLFGCAANLPCDRSDISQTLRERTGHDLNPVLKSDSFRMPKGVALNDGLTADEAVAISLWNNAQFQADLAELGFARADLIEAGLLRNPMLSLLFPLGPKQLEYTLALPIEALWQRPKRVAAAKLDAERVAENLVQHGLDLARKVMIAHADLVLADERQNLGEQNAAMQQEIVNIAAARLQAGDISELEASASRLESLHAQEISVRRTQEAVNARARFTTLLGFGARDTTFTLVSATASELPSRPFAELTTAAFASRPDLRAAELAIEVAGKRLGWERTKIFNLTGVLDANGPGKEGFEMGPGAQIEIPLFNWNNGKTARAHAQIEQAARQYLAVQQRIALEVKEAHTDYLAAQQALALCRLQWVPLAVEAAFRAQKAYDAGEVSYLFVLEINRQLLDARVREAEAAADLQRASARLKHSVGFYQMK